MISNYLRNNNYLEGDQDDTQSSEEEEAYVEKDENAYGSMQEVNNEENPNYERNETKEKTKEVEDFFLSKMDHIINYHAWVVFEAMLIYFLNLFYLENVIKIDQSYFIRNNT